MILVGSGGRFGVGRAIHASATCQVLADDPYSPPLQRSYLDLQWLEKATVTLLQYLNGFICPN